MDETQQKDVNSRWMKLIMALYYTSSRRKRGNLTL